MGPSLTSLAGRLELHPLLLHFLLVHAEKPLGVYCSGTALPEGGAPSVGIGTNVISASEGPSKK